MFQQLHVRGPHVIAWRYALFFLCGEFDCRTGQGRLYVKSAVPQGRSDQPNEENQARED
jgi:hypothetical protein